MKKSESFIDELALKTKSTEMLKEMVNRMIILGCIKEIDRNRWLEKDKAEVMRIYILIVPRRLKKLGRA